VANEIKRKRCSMVLTMPGVGLWKLKIERRGEKQGTNATHLFQYFILLASCWREKREIEMCKKRERKCV
jgi:hypothetical protein